MAYTAAPALRTPGRLSVNSNSPSSSPEPQPFARSIDDRVLAGVMGGLAKRLGWNATLLRVVFVLVSAMSAALPGILVYVILWLLMPEERKA